MSYKLDFLIPLSVPVQPAKILAAAAGILRLTKKHMTFTRLHTGRLVNM